MKMKSITFSYSLTTVKTVTLDYKKFDPKDKKFLQAWFKDDDERTPQDWDLVERNSLEKLVKKYVGDDVSWGDYVEVERIN